VTTWRLFPSGAGPARVAGTTPFLAGVKFGVTTGGNWFAGYWWWVPPLGDTGPQEFALWSVTSAAPAGSLVADGTVTSGTLTAGSWNPVPLAAPIQIAIGGTYIAATGWAATGFPDAGGQFSSGGPYAAGIVSGPLVAWSDGTAGGTNNGLYPGVQGLFSVAGTDPTAAMPDRGSDSSDFGMDIQVGDTAPDGFTGPWSLFPRQADATGNMADLGKNYILGTEVSWPAVLLSSIRYYSPPASTQLATDAGLWDIASRALVPGTHLASPAWSGAAGSGWVQVDYPSPVPIPAGDYKISIGNLSASPDVFSATTVGYFTTGPGAGGIAAGPITCPGATGATSPGQCTYQDTTGSPAFIYPDLYVAGQGQNYWLDALVSLPGPAPAAVPRLRVSRTEVSGGRGGGMNRAVRA
jgi:hypothetical protein